MYHKGKTGEWSSSKKGGVSKGTGCQKKKKQEKHTQHQKKQKTRQNTNTHSVGMSNNIYHGPNMASTSTSTTHNVCMDETSVNAQKEHINVDKSGPLTPVQNLIGEFQGVKITYKNGGGRERKLCKMLENTRMQENKYILCWIVEWTEETTSCSLTLQLLHLIQNFHLH